MVDETHFVIVFLDPTSHGNDFVKPLSTYCGQFDGQFDSKINALFTSAWMTKIHVNASVN